MNTIYFAKYDSPFGCCIIASYEGKICWFSINDDGKKFNDFVTTFVKEISSKLIKTNFNKFKKDYPNISRVITSKNISINENKNVFTNEFLLLDKYFNGEKVDLTEIEVIYLTGTPFQERVWEALRSIPYGETRSYKDLATLINSPGASRAVGTANKENNIPIIIPCHRVIKNDGTIGGYSAGVEVKKALLKLEKAEIKE